MKDNKQKVWAHMQLQGFLFILFTLIIMPVILLFSNHNIFFIVVAFVLLISSVKNIFAVFSKTTQKPAETEDSVLENLEDSVSFDVRKFGIGTKVIKGLIAVLFFFYCAFYMHFLWGKILLAIVVSYWIYDIVINNFLHKGEIHAPKKTRLKDLSVFFISISSIIVIISIAYNKF